MPRTTGARAAPKAEVEPEEDDEDEDDEEGGATVPSLAYILSQLDEEESRGAAGSTDVGGRGAAPLDPPRPLAELLEELADKEAPLTLARIGPSVLPPPEEPPAVRYPRWPARGPAEWVSSGRVAEMAARSGGAPPGAAARFSEGDCETVVEDIRSEQGALLVCDMNEQLRTRPGRPKAREEAPSGPKRYGISGKGWAPPYEAGSLTGLFGKEEKRLKIPRGLPKRAAASSSSAWPRPPPSRSSLSQRFQTPSTSSQSSMANGVAKATVARAGMGAADEPGADSSRAREPEEQDAGAPRCANCDAPVAASPIWCSECHQVQYCSAACLEDDRSFHALRCVSSAGASAPAAASSSRSNVLREGSRVRVFGLTGFQEGLNNCEGELEVWMPDICKWFVRLDDDQIESVDAENLALLPCEGSS